MTDVPKRFNEHDENGLNDTELLEASVSSRCRDKDSSEERYTRATRSFQPKRVSELPPLESESDSDDDNNLNCAILNDSFLLTPSKGIDEMGSETKAAEPMATPSQKGNNTERPARQKLEDKLIEAASVSYKRVPLLDRSQLDKQFIMSTQIARKPPQTWDSGVHSCGSSDFSSSENALKHLRKETEMMVDKVVKEQKVQSPHRECQEITDKNKHNFVTPREKFVVNHLRGTSSRMLTSTASRKSRNTIENEFKSQKILFATPVATSLSRPLMMADDSLSLSLVDTPIKSKEKSLSPIAEQLQLKRVSTEKLFPPSVSCDKRLSPEPPPPMRGALQDINKGKDIGEHSQANPLPIININGKQYQVLKKLGQGASSAVFLTKQMDTGVECAVKLVKLEGDASVIEGYLNETKLLAKLQGSENVVALYDYCHIPEANQLFLVMQKGDCDLHRILMSSKELPLYSLMQMWYQMVHCVHYIHEHGVIHLDLKPANFLIVGGRLKLIDFGIASNISLDATSIMKFSQAGTFNFISPEALIDTSTDSSPASNQPKIKMSKKSDIWSLGCILYLLLYKKTPFAHIKNVYNKVHVITNPNTVIEYPPLPNYYPPMVLEMLQRCLRYDPKARASTAELLEYPFHMVIPLNKN
ncbi:uncharacterized protein LOC129776962 isoform X2 [Toxorhynchites rutilus septentrionalis]|uniref:uncharacterized protein LOC129776962 isoform X2 n=1 Tax=Toxorhynchites rutilus septentrionalis TaxID=329112 RepID=UPI002478C2D0|nr:uncharacterized protein LOC129776962 isoform X2 [Toxorhynchites rutilus septentrionalis]